MIYGCVYGFCPTSNRKNILLSVYIYIHVCDYVTNHPIQEGLYHPSLLDII